MPLTTPLSSKIKKLRHAGVKNSIRVLNKRLTKKILRTSILRQLYDKQSTLQPNDLKKAAQVETVTPEALFDHFFQKNEAHHFLDNAASTAETVHAHFPEAVEQCIENANLICDKKFTLLGIGVFFKNEIDWHWCPENGGSWPFEPSAYYKGEGNYYRDDRIGDVRYPWELSRHQYLFTLAKAYVYTKEERYAIAATDYIVDWVERNPYRQGLHWVSTMEVAIRLISWINTIWLIKDSPYFQQNGIIAFLVGSLQHAHHINNNLTDDWLVPTNHIIGELAGLFMFASLFPQFKISSALLHKTIRILNKEAQAQIYSDGVIREQATGYNRFNTDFILLVYRLAQLNNIKLPNPIGQRLEAMINYHYHLTTPDNLAPLICDCDDGRGYKLAENLEFADYRGWQAVGAVLFNRQDFAANAGAANEEATWLLGGNDWNKFTAMPKTDSNKTSILFKEGGQAILRSNPLPEAHYVHLRCGSFGLGGDGSCSHSHADVLSTIIYWRGVPIAVDNGVYQYFGPEKYRNLLRSTRMHNTVAPKNTDQAVMHKIADWGKTPLTHVTHWAHEKDTTKLSAQMRSFNGYTHERTVAVTPEAITLEDEVKLTNQRSGGCPIEWRMHLPYQFKATCDADSAQVHIHEPQGACIAVLRHNGFDSCAIEPSIHSPAYGIMLDTVCICLSKLAHQLKASCVITDPE